MPWLDPEPAPAPEPEPTREPPSRLPRLLSVADVATWLGKSTKTVGRMIDRSELPAVTFGGTTYVPEAALIAHVDAQIAARLGGKRRRRRAQAASKSSPS